MSRLFTREQARALLKEQGLTDAPSIQNALVDGFKELLQEALEAEMDNELGYSKYDWKNKEVSNSRNGHTKKTVRSNYGNIELKIPRDTNREFEPVSVKKKERHGSDSIDDIVL